LELDRLPHTFTKRNFDSLDRKGLFESYLGSHSTLMESVSLERAGFNMALKIPIWNGPVSLKVNCRLL
jgi:hypothetical protein